MPGAMFITFEGIDGTGKTTVMHALPGRLGGTPIHTTSEPTRTPLGGMILDEIRQGAHPVRTMFLFLADRVAHAQEIHHRLTSGMSVICDRYHDSTVAYQGVLLSDIMGRERAFRLLEGMWEFFPRPDATLLFVGDVERAVQRAGRRGDITTYERAEFLTRVQDTFLEVAERESDRFVKVDADLPLEELISRVEGVVRGLLRT